MEGDEGGTDEWWVFIFHCDVVQTTVVDAGAKRFILLADEEKTRSNG